MHWFRGLLRLINQDFCPQLNRYVYWMKHPGGWVVIGILISLLAGVLISPKGYFIAFGLLALFAIGLVWPWISLRGLRTELVIPQGKLWENETLEVQFRVRNYWPLPVFGLIIEGDFLQGDLSDDGHIAFALKRVAALSETEYSIPMTPECRGHLPSGQIRLKTGFPFGLFDFSVEVECREKSLVWPACEPLDGRPQADGNRYSERGSLTPRAGTDGDTIGVRSFRSGDSMRSIHWAQTVRMQRLMVRERQSLTSANATIVLDLSADSHQGVGIHNSYECAIRVAANICYQLHESQSLVQLQCLGLSPGTQRQMNNHFGIRKLMDFLSSLPTLHQALASQTDNPLPSRSRVLMPEAGNIFLVGTDRSRFTDCPRKNVEQIVIEWDAVIDAEPVDAGVTVGGDADFLRLPANREVSERLAREWRKRMSNVAC